MNNGLARDAQGAAVSRADESAYQKRVRIVRHNGVRYAETLRLYIVE